MMNVLFISAVEPALKAAFKIFDASGHVRLSYGEFRIFQDNHEATDERIRERDKDGHKHLDIKETGGPLLWLKMTAVFIAYDVDKNGQFTVKELTKHIEQRKNRSS